MNIDRNSIQDARKIFTKLVPEKSQKSVAKFLAECVNFAHKQNPNNWNLRFDSDIGFNVGNVWVFRICPKEYSTNPRIAKTVLHKNHYQCELDISHSTFLANDRNNYMEAHHLIPMSEQENYHKKYNISLDREVNIISLCPNCHRAIHYGTVREKEKRVIVLYKKKINELKEYGINISFKELLRFYGKNKKNHLVIPACLWQESSQEIDETFKLCCLHISKQKKRNFVCRSNKQFDQKSMGAQKQCSERVYK